MPKMLHILNGDSTLHQLDKAGILGERLVWREVLVEGPVSNEIGSNLFWKERATFFHNKLHVEASNYRIKVIDELQKVPTIQDREVICWFEFDLFCQINLLGLCAYLFKHYSSSNKYALICTGYVHGYEGLNPLGHIDPQDFSGLLADRKPLTYAELEIANTLWECFVQKDYQAMKKMATKSTFNYLNSAIDQLIKTVPGDAGLNEIELKLLHLIGQGLEKKSSIIHAMLKWQQAHTVYGFGDLQYHYALEKMSDYFDVSDDCYKLNATGEKIYHDVTA